MVHTRSNSTEIYYIVHSFFNIHRPLSMSENLSKLAYKIDFYKDESEEKGKPTSEGEKETEEDKVLAPFQPSLWPWDSVRNKLKLVVTSTYLVYAVVRNLDFYDYYCKNCYAINNNCCIPPCNISF